MDERNKAYAEARNTTALAFKDFLAAAVVHVEKLAAYQAAKKEEQRLERLLRDALGQHNKYESYE